MIRISADIKRIADAIEYGKEVLREDIRPTL
jgi:hypothetical protein